MERRIRRGDMYYADFMTGMGSEQNGYRPVLIIQNDVGNVYSQTVIIAVITSQIETKAKMPTHCVIAAAQGLEVDSMILLEQIRTIDKLRLKDFIGTLDTKAMKKVDAALAISIGL